MYIVLFFIGFFSFSYSGDQIAINTESTFPCFRTHSIEQSTFVDEKEFKEKVGAQWSAVGGGVRGAVPTIHAYNHIQTNYSLLFGPVGSLSVPAGIDIKAHEWNNVRYSINVQSNPLHAGEKPPVALKPQYALWPGADYEVKHKEYSVRKDIEWMLVGDGVTKPWAEESVILHNSYDSEKGIVTDPQVVLSGNVMNIPEIEKEKEYSFFSFVRDKTNGTLHVTFHWILTSEQTDILYKRFDEPWQQQENRPADLRGFYDQLNSILGFKDSSGLKHFKEANSI